MSGPDRRDVEGLDAEFKRRCAELRDALREFPGSRADDLARVLGLGVRRRDSTDGRGYSGGGDVRLLLQAIGAVEEEPCDPFYGGRWRLQDRSAA